MSGVSMGLIPDVMKSSLATGAVFACVMIAPAMAADWSLKFGASQSLSANDNIDLSAINRDAALQSTSSFNFDLLGQAKTYEIELAPTLSVERTFFSQTDNKWSYLPAGRFDFRKMSKLTNYDVFASIARSNASSNELLDGIITTNEGDQLTYTAGATASHKINARNSLEWSNTATVVDFTIPSADLVPYKDLNSKATWRHQVSQIMGTDMAAGLEYYAPDSQVQSRAWGYRLNAGANARLTKRLSVTGDVGVVLWDPVDDNPTLGPTVSVSADYKLKSTDYALSANLDLSPGQDGKLTNRVTSNFIISHQISDMLSWGFNAGYSQEWQSGSGTASVLTVSPSLNVQLSRDWRTSLSYQYVRSDDATTSAYSNAATLSFSYGTTLIP